MTAILDLPQVRARVSPLSVADYHRLGEYNEQGRRTELICGIVIEKMSKSPLHAFVVQRLQQILTTQIGAEWCLFQEGPITTLDSEPEPDLAVVEGPIERYREVHPSTAELVIEVAVSSIEVDRAKAAIYASAGVKEYWIVCPEEKMIEVYRAPRGLDYAEQLVVRAPEILRSLAIPSLSVGLAALLE